MSLRLLPLVVLLLLPLVARADGFAFGKASVFRQIRETDQVAVIHCAPGRVTVDMYIAIDGIPPGESVTYVLPFWHKAEGFTLEEQASDQFRTATIKPAADRVEDMNTLGSKATRSVGQAMGALGAVVGGPLALVCMPGVWDARSKSRGRQASAAEASSGSLTPHEVHDVPSARAELYSGVKAGDLQALVAQAGLPATYSEPLKRYHTEHFAVMTLRGLPTPAAKKGEAPFARGVHYRFTHAADGTSYTYTYPLGTGAAWPKPIMLTEVFVHTADDLLVQATAPEIGEKRNAYQAYNFARLLRHDPEYAAEMPEALQPATTSLLAPSVRAGSAWHVAYLNSNPAEDIAIAVRPREDMGRLRLARVLGQPPVGWAMALFVFLVALVPSWFVVRAFWVRADRPGGLWGHWLKGVGWMVATALFATAVAWGLQTGRALTDDWFLVLILALALCPAVVWLYRRSETMTPAQYRLAIGTLIGALLIVLGLGVSEVSRAATLALGPVVTLLGLPQVAALWFLTTRTGPLARRTYVLAWLVTVITFTALAFGAMALASWAGDAVRG